jgi:hypothetical protein
MPNEVGAVPLDRLMSTSDVASFFGRSVAWFQRNNKRFGWIIPVRTIGRSDLYDRVQVEALHRTLRPYQHDDGRHRPPDNGGGQPRDDRTGTGPPGA